MSLLSSTIFQRQANFVDYNDLKNERIIIIGAGNLGSIVGVTLSKIGFKNVLLVDGDTVDHHNLPNQWYRRDDVGSDKTYCLANTMYDYAPEGNTSFISRTTMFQATYMLFNPTVVIICVDSTKSRIKILQQIYYGCNTYAINKKPYIIDTGTNELSVRLTAFYLDDEEYREKYNWLLHDWLDTPDNRVCGRSAIMFVAQYCASQVGMYIYKYLHEQKNKFIINIDIASGIDFAQEPEERKPIELDKDVVKLEPTHLHDLLQSYWYSQNKIIKATARHCFNNVDEITKGVYKHRTGKIEIPGIFIATVSCDSCICMTCVKSETTDCPITQECSCKDHVVIVSCTHYQQILLPNYSTYRMFEEIGKFNKLPQDIKETIITRMIGDVKW